MSHQLPASPIAAVLVHGGVFCTSTLARVTLLLRMGITSKSYLKSISRPAARWGRLLAVSFVVGIFAGLAAAALEGALRFGSFHLVGRFADLGQATVFKFRAGVLLLPVLGGLISGVVLTLCKVPLAGHGTDVLVRAFHKEGGQLRLKSPLVKAVAAVGVIACGGSAGPEGPIAALGAALGSAVSRWLGLSPRECRVLLLAGCGAGVGAIFQCPLGGALFAVSILYQDPDFETDAVAPALVASVIGYSTYMLFWGYGHHLLSGTRDLVFSSPIELIPYALLGPVCGVLCVLFYYCLKLIEHSCRRVHALRWLLPALGGLGTGLIACLLPQVMDGQYSFIQNALDGALEAGAASMSWWDWALLFAAVALAKCVATGCTVGTGGSGGVLGPSVFIGGAAGAFLGALFEAAFPGMFTADVRYALIPVGMGGVLAASMRVPLAAIVMVTEMTGSYGLMVPLMLVCITSYLIGRRWGLNDEQVRNTAASPVHAGDTVVHMLEGWRVQNLIQNEWTHNVPLDATLKDIVKSVPFGTRPVIAVTSGPALVGVITAGDFERLFDEPDFPDTLVAADLMSSDYTLLSRQDDAYYAMTEMARGNYLALPVVEDHDDRQFVGMLTRKDIFDAIRRRFDELRQQVMEEHVGLAAISQEDELYRLMIGIPAASKDIVQRLLVPLDALGKSLRESQLRRDYGIHVLAIENPDGSIECPPDPDMPLTSSHRLVALKTEDM